MRNQNRQGPGALAARERAGKFLTFHLADEEYGAEILKVQEIIGMQPITRVPELESLTTTGEHGDARAA